MTRDDDNMLAAEYVLGVLPHAERVAFAKRLASDAALMSEVRFWEQHLSSLAEQVEPVTPPARVWNAIERRLFTANEKPASSWWESLAFWRGLSLAALTSAATLAAVIFFSPDPVQTNAETLIAELSGETGAFKLAALYDTNSGSLKINRIEGAAASGRALELWLIEGANKPVSLGVLPQDAKASIVIAANLRTKLANATLAISDEPAGGSPTGQPTGAVLAAGKIHTI